MADQLAVKKVLQDLVKREDLKNKVCNDCSNPNPQWASLSFAVFLCLQCAGIHRGFGVHISFVRSISMDAWQDEQVKRMQLGGNAPFREFMRAYTPVEQGGYSDGASSYDTYHCWAATQYREKLDATLAGRDWAPTAPPKDTANAGNGSARPNSPSSAQGLRKSRTSARSTLGSSLRSDSASPASLSNSLHDTDLARQDQKAANESYFASLGETNAARPADLPPSQGGRYQGFGSTPAPSSNEHPSFGLSSGAAPTMTDFQENPRAALSKGWSLFSAAVVGASKVVSENVIQPGMEKVTDPNLHASVRGYMTEAQKRATSVGSSANQWSKNQFGVDVAESVGGVVGTVKEKIGAGPTSSGYGSIAQENDAETSALYQDDEDSFLGQYGRDHDKQSSQATSTATTTAAPAARQNDWDEWKDF